MYMPRENKDWGPRSTAIMDFHMKKKLFYAANNLKEKGIKYNFLRYGPIIWSQLQLYVGGLGESPTLTPTSQAYTSHAVPVRNQYKCLVPIYVFPEMKLLFPKQNGNVLSPSSYTHISVRDLYISRIDLPILLQPNMWTDPGKKKIGHCTWM